MSWIPSSLTKTITRIYGHSSVTKPLALIRLSGSTLDWIMFLRAARLTKTAPAARFNAVLMPFCWTNRFQVFTYSGRKDGRKDYLKPVSHVVDSIFSHEDDNADIRTQFSYKTIGADTVIWKYIGLDNVSSRRPPYESSASWQVYRSADAYMLKALASLMLEDYATAFNFVNMIREARGLEELLPEETDYTNKEFMMDMIFRERAREFAFEGKRWYDLMLWSELSGRNVLAEKVSFKYPESQRAERKAYLEQESNWYLPIDAQLWQ